MRERILDGFYVDIFTLLKHEAEATKTGKKRDKKGPQNGAQTVILIISWPDTLSL